MKHIFVLVLIFSNSVLAGRRVIPPNKNDVVNNFGGVKEGELYFQDNELYFRHSQVDALLFYHKRDAKITIPTLTIKSVQKNGTVDDVVYIGPGRIFINHQELINTDSIECKPNSIGFGGRLDEAAVPNTQWSKMYLYLTAHPLPTTNVKFTCFLDSLPEAGNYPNYGNLHWLRVSVIPRVWDATTSRYRNAKSLIVYNRKIEPLLNNASAGVYGTELAIFTTSPVPIYRQNTCRRAYPFIDGTPDKASFTITNYDFTSIDIYSDFGCTKKVYTIASAVNGVNNVPIIPLAQDNGFYMKGTLNGANTGGTTTVTGTAFGLSQ